MSTPFSPLGRKSPGPTCWSDQRGFFSGRGTCSNARTMPEHRCSAIYIRGRRYREIAALDKWDRARAATPNSSPRRAVAQVLPRAQRGALANRATLTPAEQASRPRCRRRPGAEPAAFPRKGRPLGSDGDTAMVESAPPYRNSFARSSPRLLTTAVGRRAGTSVTANARRRTCGAEAIFNVLAAASS